MYLDTGEAIRKCPRPGCMRPELFITGNPKPRHQAIRSRFHLDWRHFDVKRFQLRSKPVVRLLANLIHGLARLPIQCFASLSRHSRLDLRSRSALAGAVLADGPLPRVVAEKWYPVVVRRHS